MKIVAAKCPSCGADIEVDENGNQTICDFCGSKIMIQEAIQKFQISGEVEVKNMPKLENYIKIGNRHFEDKEFDEAYLAFSNAVDLDPDNYLAVLKKGLSKTLSLSVKEFNTSSCSNGIKNATQLFKGDEGQRDNLTKEINDGLRLVVAHACDLYNKNMSAEELGNIYKVLIYCMNTFDYLCSSTNNNTLKEMIAVNMLGTINCISIVRVCKDYRNGRVVYPIYLITKETRNKMSEYQNKYKKILINLKPGVYNQKTNMSMFTIGNYRSSFPNINTTLLIAKLFFPVLFVLSFLGQEEYLSAFFMIIFCVLLIPQCYHKIFKPEGNIPNSVRIIALIIVFIMSFSTYQNKVLKKAQATYMNINGYGTVK